MVGHMMSKMILCWDSMVCCYSYGKSVCYWEVYYSSSYVYDLWLVSQWVSEHAFMHTIMTPC